MIESAKLGAVIWVVFGVLSFAWKCLQMILGTKR